MAMMQTVRSLALLALAVGLVACTALPTRPVLPGEEAARLRALQEMADSDNGLAQAQLAVLYYDGRGGIERDPARAYELFARAAVTGCPASQLYLGLMHLSGEHLPKDMERASFWFRKAADQGRTDLSARLIELHGEEIPLRLRVAYEWIRDPIGAVPVAPR